MVVVTGMGAVSAAGVGCEAYEACIYAGRTAIGDVPDLEGPERQPKKGGRSVEPPRPASVGPTSWERWDRCVRLAAVALDEALRQGGLAGTAVAERPTGLFVGTSLGGVMTALRAHRESGGEGLDASSADLAGVPLGSVADELARCFGVRGPRITVSNACVSGANCLGLALDAIRDGVLERALCVGADTLHAFTFTGFSSMWALALDAMKPFDRVRTGMMLGEAGAAMLLESDASAARRGARPCATVLGYGLSGDAVHVSAPDREGGGIARAMRMALADAGLDPSRIDWVNANATGSGYGDASESQAIRSVFGERADTVPVSSVKPVTGHTLGAAGVLEAIASVLSLRSGRIPPNVGGDDPDPACPIGAVARTVLAAPVSAVLSNSAGFGGATACLVFGRADGRDR